MGRNFAAGVTGVWRTCSMNRMRSDIDLQTITEGLGEVKWMLDWSLQQDIPTPVVSAAQPALMTYRDRTSPTAKAVALLRHQFGGHPVYAVKEEKP